MTRPIFTKDNKLVKFRDQFLPWNVETNAPRQTNTFLAKQFLKWAEEDIANDGTGLPDPYEESIVVPIRVSRRKFMMQLQIQGLLAAVLAYVDAQAPLIKIAFLESATFDRNDEMLIAGFTAMNFSSEEIDEFYLAASSL